MRRWDGVPVAAPRPPLTGPRFIGSEIYRSSRYGSKHPLGIPRVSTAIDLCRALGALPDEVYLDSPVASDRQLARFHAPDYIAAVRRAERDGGLPEDERQRFGVGVRGNPVFPEVFSRPATACGATLLAADLLRDGGVVYSPAGGTHHGRPAEAWGFCYFNDPVLGALAFLDSGLERVAYVDVDAHHCDGVADAFREDPRVLVVSVHEAGIWPGTGAVEDRGAGNIVNLPAPAGLNDDEFLLLLEQVVVPRVAEFRPQALIIQGGADALEEDPLSKLALSNNSHRAAVRALADLAPRTLVLGGGGYNPWSVARCWTVIWAELTGFELPRAAPAEAEAVLGRLSWSHRLGRNPPERWSTTILDERRGGPIRDEVRSLARAAGGAS